MCKYSWFLLKNIFERTLRETSINLTVITTIINNERKKQPNDFFKEIAERKFIKIDFQKFKNNKTRLNR